MSKIILIVGILLATSYFGDTDNVPDSGTKSSRNAWFPAIPADSAFSKNRVDINSRDKRSMTVVVPMQNIHGNEDNNYDDQDDEEMDRKNYKTKRCRGLPSHRKIKLYREPEEEVVSYAIQNPRSLGSLDPSRNLILQMAEDKQVSSEESEEEEQPYLRIAAVRNPNTILKNILRSKSMQRYEETEINRDNAILKRVKTHLRPDDCNVLALIGKRAGSTRPNKPRKFVCYYEDNNCGNDAGQMVLQAYPSWKKARPVFLDKNNYDINDIPTVQQNHHFQKFAQTPLIPQYSQPSVLTKSQNPIVGSQIVSGTLKTQSGTVLMDTGNGIQKQQFENIKNRPILQFPQLPLNIQYGVPPGQINWQQLNRIASADSAIQQNGFVGQQIKPHASVQTPFIQNCDGTSYSANNVIDQSNQKMVNQQHSMEQKIEDEYVGNEQTVPRGGKKSWPIGRTELGKSFRNVEDCIKLYGREFCVVDAMTLSHNQWKNDFVQKIGLHSEDGHPSTDYSDRDTLNYASTPLSANYGHRAEEQMINVNYQYDSTSPKTLTQLKYTSEQPFVAQNKIIKGSDESYETVATNFGYSSDHKEEQTVESNYQYDSKNPETLTQFQYTSELPFVAQTAQNKIIKESAESYEAVPTDFGYSTVHNEEQTVDSNYQYDSRNHGTLTQLKHTSEQPLVAQTAQNKIIKGSEESYEAVPTDFGYSTDHNEEQMVDSNYQYDSRNPEPLTQLQYTSEQPLVAQTAQNNIIKGSTESYEAVSTDFGYSTVRNEEQTVDSNYQYDSRNHGTLTQLKHTSEQPLVAQTAQNKIIKGSEESYEAVPTDFGYSTDHNEEQTVDSNYQYDSKNPETLTQLQYTSEQPLVAQTAQNKIIKGSAESYEAVPTDFGYSTDHNEEQTVDSNYQYDSRNHGTLTQLKYTSEQPLVAQTAQNKIIKGSEESYEAVPTDFGYSTDHNEEQTVDSNYQYDSKNPETLTQLQYTSELPFVAQTAQNKIIKGSDESYEAVTTDYGYSPENDFIGQTSNYELENNSKQRIQENHVQNAQNQIDEISNVDTSDYYDNTVSQNSHIYQYEDNSVHDNNNNMKYNDQSLSHDTYGTYDTYGSTTQKYFLGQKQKANLHSDSRHHIVDSSYMVPVTPYENDHSFYTTVNNLQYYNDYSSDDKNDLTYPVIVSDDTREYNYAENTEPYTGNRYYSVQPEYYAMTEMPQSIHHGESVAPSLIIGTGIPSLAQTKPALLEHSTYSENTIERPLEMTNNQYEQVQKSRPLYDYIPSHHYTNIDYFNEQLNNHQLGKAYSTQDFDNTKYINNNYNFKNHPNFYDTRVKNIWENSERILSPDTENEHTAPDNILRKMYEGVQEHQSPPGPEWNSERFSSLESSKESTAADHTEITEITNGYSFVDHDFDKAYGIHTSNPINYTDLFINDGEDQFNSKFTDINDSQIERQPQDILGHVASTNSLEKFVDFTGNVLHSVEFQTDRPDDIHSLGDSMEDLVEMENFATEVTSAESTETPYGEKDSSRDLDEKYSPSISVDLTSPHSREYFIPGTGEDGNSTPLRDLVGQSLHEQSAEHNAKIYSIERKDLDVKNAGNIKPTIYVTEANLNPSIDLPTDQESTLIPDIVGEYFGTETTNRNTITQNSDKVNFTPTENVQSMIYGTGENLITPINFPKDEELTPAPDIIGKPFSQEISREDTDTYILEAVTPKMETTDFTLIGKSSEDNKNIIESGNGIIESPIIGNSKCSVINNEQMSTTKEYLPDDKNYLKATIKSVINNFASNRPKDMVGSSENSKLLETGNSEDLLPEIINTPMLKTLLALPDVENTLTDMVKDTLSKSPYGTKYKSVLKSESDTIKSIMRDVIAELENSLPTDYPITVEEHEFKGGKWVTEQVTLLPTVPVEQRVQIPFSETVNRIILRTLKNVVKSPMLGSKAASHPVVQNVIMETVKNALRKADVNTTSIEDSTLREILDKLIQEMKTGMPSATESLRDSFDSSVPIVGHSIDGNTKISMTENNSELETWTTTDNIQTQMEHPENLSKKKISENNDKVVLLTSTDNPDEKSSILGQTSDTSDYDNYKEEPSLLDEKISNHVPSTNPEIDDAFSSAGYSTFINDEKESQTAREAEDYKILGESNEKQCHHFSTESNDESPLKSVQSQIFDNTQADDSVEENVQVAHSTPIDNDFPLKSSQGLNLDKIQIDKSTEENVQEAHSTPILEIIANPPILSSSVINKCNDVSPDRMNSHRPHEGLSSSSDEIIDGTLAVTEYPDLKFDNDHTEHIVGMPEKLPTNNYNDLTSISSAESSNNSPEVPTKTTEKVSSNAEVTDINGLLEKAPIKYYSPNDRILEYKKNHLQYWNTESVTSMPSNNDMDKETIVGTHQSCSYSMIRKNGNNYDDNNDTMEKMNSPQYNNNESQTNEYTVGNNREIITPKDDKKVNQEMIKSETSSAVLESTMNIISNSKVNDYDDTEGQAENNLQQFTSDGIVGLTEPQDATGISKKKYIDSYLDETRTQDISNGEYISSVSQKNIQNDSRFEDTQEENMFDETAINSSLDEGTFSHVQDNSKLTATQQENTFFETTINPSSGEETFIQPEQYDESEMTTDISEEETSRSKEHVNLAGPKENKKSLEKLIDSEEVSDVNDMSEMIKDISDEDTSKSEEYANVAESRKSEKSLETLIDSEEINDLDNASYDTAEFAKDLNTADSPILNNDDYNLAESQEYSSKMENAQRETYEKSFEHNSSTSQYLGASKGNIENIKTIQMEESTRMGIPDLKSSNQNKILKQTKRKEKLIPTKSHEIITKTIQKTITKTTKYYGAEDSIEDTTDNHPNDEIVSATKSSCFSNSDHDFTYFGKLLPKCGRNQGNDISELTNSDLYYIGDGVRLPLTIKKLDDGSYGLSISEKVCEHFMNTKCPCCVPRDGTIVSEKRNSHEGRNLKRDLWKFSKESSVEGERDYNEKVQDKVGKSKTRYVRSTQASISGTQQKDRIIIPERHSPLLRSMPVQTFAKKYNLILDLAKRSVTENVQKTVTETDMNNKSILNNDKEIEHEEKTNFTETEQNVSNNLNETNRNEIFDGNQTSNLVNSLIAINDAPESKRAGIVINALENLIKTEPIEIYTVVDDREKEMETLNMKHEDEDADATCNEEIAKYGYQKDNPILGRIKFIKALQKEQSQPKYQQTYDDAVTKKMEILKVILYWLKDVFLRIPVQNKS